MKAETTTLYQLFSENKSEANDDREMSERFWRWIILVESMFIEKKFHREGPYNYWPEIAR